MKNWERFTSRKFLVALATVVAIAFPGLGLDEEALVALVAGVYILAQGLVDAKKPEPKQG